MIVVAVLDVDQPQVLPVLVMVGRVTGLSVHCEYKVIAFADV